MRQKFIKIFVALMIMAFPFSVLADDAKTDELIEKGHKLLSGWQVELAGKVVDKLMLREVDSPEANYLFGRYFFEAGDYATALDYYNGAAEYTTSLGENYPQYLQAAYENTKDFNRKTSEHFEVRYAPGKDEIIVDMALETLEKTHESLTKDLGFIAKRRIVLEIYPKLEHLSRATGLSLKAIHTTGTIAICKFGRIMITSPAVSPMGYGWRDTINHEYVHLVISSLSGNKVPIWLHEGLAKFHEERWRLPLPGKLELTSESLLGRAIKEDKLVTLDEMHPSMSLLPSQTHAAIGYSTVQSMIEWLYRRGGSTKLAKLLTTIRKTNTLDQAFLKVYGFDTRGLERNWKNEMSVRRMNILPFTFDDYSVYFGTNEKDDADKQIKNIKSRRGRNLMTLGKLLKDRQHDKAAVIELQKASETLGPYHPLLQNYLADSLIKLKHHSEAIDKLKPVLDASPNYLPSHIRSARAYNALGDHEKAVERLEYALGINPYDPRIHVLLADSYKELSQPTLSDQAKDNLKKLGFRAK